MSSTEEKRIDKEIERMDPKEKALPKIGEEILIRFSAALKTSQIYKSNNLTFLRQCDLFFNKINDTITEEGEVVFKIRESTVFFNSIRVKFDFSNYQSFKFIVDELKNREIGVLGFDPGLDEDELKRFIVLLNTTEVNEENTFEDLQTKIKGENISHIFIEKIHPFEQITRKQTKYIKRYAKRVFFKSITHLKEVFDKERQNKRVQLKTTRRLMQSIVNLMIQDESFMVGMTNLKNYDEYTLNHSINVCVLSVCLGRRLGLDKKELVDLGISAFFHDIGKLDIPKEILEKSSKLTEEERRIMEKHTFLGAGKLVRLKELSYLPIRALYVALEHHLRSDLSGYPIYWKKDSINFYSKIVEICDFFDALTTKRPYREDVFTRNDTLSLMLEKSGTDFDPLLLKVFANMVGAYPIGTLVVLDTDEMAVVMDENPDVAFFLRPKAKLITDTSGNKIDGKIVDLAEMSPSTNNYTRTIIKSLNSHDYNIDIAQYFLAQEDEVEEELIQEQHALP